MNSSKSIFIVEDEPLIAADISDILQTNGYKVAGKADSADVALEKLRSVHADLVLLDIKIEGERNGIDLARDIRKKYSMPHIFLTSFYDESTLAQAQATLPQAYIVKPFEERDLIINVSLAIHRVAAPVVAKPIDKFFVRNNQEMISIETKDIYYVEADDNYATLVTSKGKHIVSHTLKSVSEKLVPLGFVRVHRSYLVNFDRITSINEGYIYLDAHKIPLSNTYREDIVRSLNFL